MCFNEWKKIAVTSEDTLIVQFLRFRFPAGYTRPVPTPSTGNAPQPTTTHGTWGHGSLYSERAQAGGHAGQVHVWTTLSMPPVAYDCHLLVRDLLTYGTEVLYNMDG